MSVQFAEKPTRVAPQIGRLLAPMHRHDLARIFHIQRGETCSRQLASAAQRSPTIWSALSRRQRLRCEKFVALAPQWGDRYANSETGAFRPRT